MDINETRKSIDAIFSALPLIGRTHEIEKATDYAIEAKMWLGKVLGEMGDEAYLNSKDASNITVEPTADQGEVSYSVKFAEFEKQAEEDGRAVVNYNIVLAAAIMKVKFMRAELTNLATDMKSGWYQLEDKSNLWLNAYYIKSIHEVELSCMWLGMELSELSRKSLI